MCCNQKTTFSKVIMMAFNKSLLKSDTEVCVIHYNQDCALTEMEIAWIRY